MVLARNDGASSSGAEIRALSCGASLLGTSCASHVSVSRPVSPHSVSPSCDAHQAQVSFRSYALVLGAEPLSDINHDDDQPPTCCALLAESQRTACLRSHPPSTPSSPRRSHPACSPASFSGLGLRSASYHSDMESLCEEVRIPASPAAMTLVPLLPPTSPQRCQVALRRKRSCAAMTLSGSSTRRRQHHRISAEHQQGGHDEIGFDIGLPT
jgi:hypothetical protein